MNLTKVLGWAAVIGLGVFAYSQYKKTKKNAVKVNKK